MVALKGEKVNLYGKTLKVGDLAPMIVLVDKDFGLKSVGGASGKYQVISVIPSIDGSVCQTQTRAFVEKIKALGNVDLFTVCVDLPFATGRFCSDSALKTEIVSDFRDKLFGKVYGLLLTSGLFEGLLTRAVLVVDPQGTIIYQEICKDIVNEPDYEAALKALP